MQIKQEKKTIKKILKEIVEYIIISFFFVFFFLTILLVLFENQIDKTINFINMISVENKIENNENVSFNQSLHKLSTYPTYGSTYGKLIIKSINLNYPIYHGDTSDLLMKGIGHYAGSFFPGEGGSIIMAAHNNVHFQNLYDVKQNDIIEVDTIYGNFKYKVYDTSIIKDNESDKLPIQSKEEILMLYTCYPKTAVGHASKRFVVYSKLVEAKYE